ncbi:MAG: hypothetical protein K940chlam3_01147 [Chlamydiae bacterium]|nr:hypothetical protein [Chlamydiota bacterium]
MIDNGDNITVKKSLFSLIFCTFCLFFSHIAAVESPLVVYLTWQQHPESTMTVHWISPEKESDDIVYYRQNDNEPWKKAVGIHDPLPEGRSDFLIHTVEILNLQPDSVYFFKVGDENKINKFKTMPREMTKPIRFIDGGDLYHDSVEILDKTNTTAAKFDPMFAFLGGDIAYAADKYGRKPEDFSRWLAFLQSWHKNMVTSDGRMVPVLPVTSNEDTKGRYDQTPKEAPFFYALFAMPGQQGYNVLDFGNYMTVVLLDSGHTHPVYGDQASWLEKTLKIREHFPHKFAVYHVPAYPCVRSMNKQPVSIHIRNHWVPIFEKHNLSVAFEHHDHAYKRSVLIRNGKEDPTGVLYLGDGGYGVSNPRKPASPSERWYLAHTAQKTNFIVGTLFPNGNRKFMAVDHEGDVFDEYSMEK